MTTASWVTAALGEERVDGATTEAARRRLAVAFRLPQLTALPDASLCFVADAMELAVFDVLEDENQTETLRELASHAFVIARTLSHPAEPIAAATFLVRLGCLAVLGDRGADFRRLLKETGIPELPITSGDWGQRVWATILDLWLRMFRKEGWADLDAVQARVARLRADQRSYEPGFLQHAEDAQDPEPAWRLMAEYHLAKAAELLALYGSQGSADGHFDIRQQLEAQFDRAIDAAARGRLMELELLVRLLARTAQTFVDNSIWTVTRAVNSRVTRFVQQLVARSRQRPLFEMLPPQRKTLREEGLLGSGHRSVVVSLPTSSGKTFIAEFRMLQALNQFDHERGWVAYLAPTRALVNQITVRLRRDFGDLGIVVERVSPALEVDGLEATLLTENEGAYQFRVLVTTPEKLDLMLRGGWEQRIGRPLTLVVVDEAHGIGSEGRGLRLELLLATINRECRHAQFLLLTPFVRNAAEIARWLAPDSHQDIELGLDWSPNDRAIMLVQPERAQEGGRGAFALRFATQHTSKATLSIPEELKLAPGRPLGLSWSAVSTSQGKLAAATAEILRWRGAVIVLADRPRNAWGIARAFQHAPRRMPAPSGDVVSVQRFLAQEMGEDFPLQALLGIGVGVHHAGMSDDTKALVEWLTEQGDISVLVATTTIAQGVNFPVAGIVLASHQYPYGQDMPPEDFWNIAGRAGRVDQGDLGIVALAATDESKAEVLRRFVARGVGELNSTLVTMVQAAIAEGKLGKLESLGWQPAWSSFLQYLAHTYRQMGDHERFAAEVEQVLRGTLGFSGLRRSHPGWANQLVLGVRRYADRLRDRPLKLVDSTGFSWETVSSTLARLAEQRITGEVWGRDLFGSGRSDLQRMMGILLQVPELRTQLQDVTGGSQPDGAALTNIVCDWVQGCPLPELARTYFAGSDDEGADPVAAMTRCCQRVFGKLTSTASWGLAALQTLTLKDDFDGLPLQEQRRLRNLPARVFYGVNSEEAVVLRLLGVPRLAATPLARQLGVQAEESLSQTRARLKQADAGVWRSALGEVGEAYRRVWSIIEGER